MTSKELQAKYIQFQLVKQQLSALIHEKNIVDQKVAEIVTAMASLKELAGVKQGEEMWSPLGGSVFIKSSIKDVEKAFVGVGAGVVLMKNRDTAIAILASRLDELARLDKNLVAEIKNFSAEAEKLQSDVESLAEKEK